MKKDRIQDKFLDELREIPIIQVACKRIGISRNSVYRWRNEDPYFASLMKDALAEGEESMNDLTEGQLLSLIKEKHFQAIRFWLTLRHPKFKKEEIPEKIDREAEADEIIKELGLTSVDFTEENRIATASKISKYLSSK